MANKVIIHTSKPSIKITLAGNDGGVMIGLADTVYTDGTYTKCIVFVNPQTSPVLTFIPFENFHIVNVTIDAVSQGIITTYTFTNIFTNHTVIVTFAAD